MFYMQLPLWLMILITVSITMFATASRRGEKIHFQDSSELEELDIDKRPVHQRDNRNHRGRAVYNHEQGNVAKFEEGLPDVYPIRGPPQAPFVLPTTTGNAAGLQNHNAQESSPLKPVQLPLGHHYAGNPFLAKYQTMSAVPTTATTNKYNPPNFPGITNQLPSSDKPTTATPSHIAPTLATLLDGSKLLQEEDAKRDAADEISTDISFKDRGLFDTAPHCRPGQILVGNKCRMAV